MKSAFSAVVVGKDASEHSHVIEPIYNSKLKIQISNLKLHQNTNNDHTETSLKSNDDKPQRRCEYNSQDLDEEEKLHKDKSDGIDTGDLDQTNKVNKGLNTRADVVLKTILRNFKKYYVNEFKNFSGYSNSKRANYDQNDILDKAKEFIVSHIEDDGNSESVLFLLSLIDFKIKINELADKHKSLWSLISSLLYSFNKK